MTFWQLAPLISMGAVLAWVAIVLKISERSLKKLQTKHTTSLLKKGSETKFNCFMYSFYSSIVCFVVIYSLQVCLIVDNHDVVTAFVLCVAISPLYYSNFKSVLNMEVITMMTSYDTCYLILITSKENIRYDGRFFCVYFHFESIFLSMKSLIILIHVTFEVKNFLV